MKLQVLILEKNQEDRERLKKQIRQFFQSCGPDVQADAPEGSFNLQSVARYDFLFLNAEQEQDLEIGRMIKEKNKFCQIILTSSSGNFLQKGYEIHACRYLIKPITQEQLNENMLGILKDHDPSLLSFYDPKISRLRILYHRIVYVDYFKKSSYLILNPKVRIKTPYPFYYWIEFLKEFPFVQCYKSLLVNCDHISFFDKDHLTVTTGETLPVSRKYKKVFKEKWLESLQKRM